LYTHRSLVFLGCLVFFGACPVFASDDVVGIWSSTTRTKGGLGPQWVFGKDGNAIHTFGALVDFKYEVLGNQIKMTLLAPDHSETREVSSQEFSIDGDTLIVNPLTPEKKQVMKRAGQPVKGAPALVGDWTYTHSTGGPALMRYSRSGIVQLSVPFQTHTGTYRIHQDTLSVTLRGQKPISAVVRREKEFLMLTDSEAKKSKYIHFEY
jgi:hypothetical protein